MLQAIQKSPRHAKKLLSPHLAAGAMILLAAALPAVQGASAALHLVEAAADHNGLLKAD
jgi:hypothetical protein